LEFKELAEVEKLLTILSLGLRVLPRERTGTGPH